MSNKDRTTAQASEEIPFGARVFIDRADNSCRVALDEMSGVARRQWGVGDKRGYQPGETVDIQLQGEILCDFGAGNLRRVALRRGKIVG